MKKTTKLTLALTLVAALSLFSISAKAQPNPAPVDVGLKTSVVDSIASKYSDWKKLSISGKIYSSLIPLTGSASVKIYMEKDNLTVITFSAPFVGEAARIEVDNESVLLVNKLKKKYSQYSYDQFRHLYPGGQEELQNLILGRVTILGKGQLTSKDASSLEIYDPYPDNWVIIPNSDFQQNGTVYFYAVERGTLNLSQFMLMSETGDAEMSCFYNWDKKDGVTMDLQAAMDKMSVNASLKLNQPVSISGPIDRFAFDSRFKKVSFKELFK